MSDINMSDINQKFLDGVGGRNLVLKSDVPYNNSNYLIADYTLSKPMEVGKTYTITVKGNVENTDGGLAILRDNGRYFMSSNVDKVADDLYQVTFEATNDTFVTNSIRLYNYPSASRVSANIEWIKLEEGKIGTDWTPAPEDINFEKYVKNTRYGINKILAYYYPSVKGSEKDTYLFLNHLNNSIYTTNYKIALCLTLIENGKFNMTRFQELKSKIAHLSKYIYSLETLIRYTLENIIYIKD